MFTVAPAASREAKRLLGHDIAAEASLQHLTSRPRGVAHSGSNAAIQQPHPFDTTSPTAVPRSHVLKVQKLPYNSLQARLAASLVAVATQLPASSSLIRLMRQPPKPSHLFAAAETAPLRPPRPCISHGSPRGHVHRGDVRSSR